MAFLQQWITRSNQANSHHAIYREKSNLYLSKVINKPELTISTKQASRKSSLN